MEMISILIIPQPVREVKRNRSRYSDGISEKRPKTTNFFAFKGDSGCLLAWRDERFYAWRGAKNPYLRHYRVIPMARITTGRVEFFVRRYKNLQAVAELQARIFVKDHGKGASECVNRELRGDAFNFISAFRHNISKLQCRLCGVVILCVPACHSALPFGEHPGNDIEDVGNR